MHLNSGLPPNPKSEFIEFSSNRVAKWAPEPMKLRLQYPGTHQLQAAFRKNGGLFYVCSASDCFAQHGFR
jgi:hypothetical protein